MSIIEGRQLQSRMIEYRETDILGLQPPFHPAFSGFAARVCTASAASIYDVSQAKAAMPNGWNLAGSCFAPPEVLILSRPVSFQWGNQSPQYLCCPANILRSRKSWAYPPSAAHEPAQPGLQFRLSLSSKHCRWSHPHQLREPYPYRESLNAVCLHIASSHTPLCL